MVNGQPGKKRGLLWVTLLAIISMLSVTRVMKKRVMDVSFLHASFENNNINPTHVDQPIRVGLCVIASNEEAYLGEFIQYYLDFGVHHIFLYDNSENTDNVYTPAAHIADHVTVIPYPGQSPQMASYTNCVFHHGTDFDWMGFLDVDEYIVSRNHNSIQSLLATVDDDGWCGAACINWRMFGDSGLTEYDDRCVTHRFVHRREQINMHVKCFARPAAIDAFITPHSPVMFSGFHQYSLSFETTFNQSGPWFHPIPSFEPDVVIHHYYTKTKPEYQRKVARGRADIPMSREGEPFENVNAGANAVYDDSAWTRWMERIHSTTDQQNGQESELPCT
jgi:hypothetical protein